MKYLAAISLGLILSTSMSHAMSNLTVSGVDIPEKVFQQCAGSKNFYNCAEQAMKAM
ncbi:hypothetical protein [Vibrio tapetis]|uniref:Secreted protein n=1 Tax=Vibrio tapetis subsp. tapetis TaxID=1671868 RepID=A0A2N8ZBT5_9VIBR|nr:hypothetical protein [Vibrio tapetis]SON49369.1 exported protein of unknown function [Vibrio tapetis subsp. tapetis]